MAGRPVLLNWTVRAGALLSGVTFIPADLLSSQLADVGVLVLTNQCWDDDLMDKVRGGGQGAW